MAWCRSGAKPFPGAMTIVKLRFTGLSRMSEATAPSQKYSRLRMILPYTLTISGDPIEHAWRPVRSTYPTTCDQIHRRTMSSRTWPDALRISPSITLLRDIAHFVQWNPPAATGGIGRAVHGWGVIWLWLGHWACATSLMPPIMVWVAPQLFPPASRHSGLISKRPGGPTVHELRKSIFSDN